MLEPLTLLLFEMVVVAQDVADKEGLRVTDGVALEVAELDGQWDADPLDVERVVMEAVGVTQAEAETLEVRLGLAVALVEEQPLREYDCVGLCEEERETVGETEIERQAVLETDSVPVLHTVTETLVVEDVVGDATLLLLLLALIDTVGLDDDDAEGLFEGVWVAQALDVVVGQ